VCGTADTLTTAQDPRKTGQRRARREQQVVDDTTDSTADSFESVSGPGADTFIPRRDTPVSERTGRKPRWRGRPAVGTKVALHKEATRASPRATAGSGDTDVL